MKSALTEVEIQYAEKLKNLIEKYGFDNLAELEFKAGNMTGLQLKRVLSWLKESGWEKADLLIAADEAIINMPDPEPKTKREKNVIDQKLMRRLRNVFTREDFARLHIKEMTYKEALALCEAKEEERLKYGIRF